VTALPYDPGDKMLLLLSACLLALLTILAVIFRNGSDEPLRGFPSTYSTARDGSKATYTLLEEMGYRVEHWTRPPGELPSSSGNTLLIIAGPSITPSSDETVQLRQFVAGGGRLLLTGASSAAVIGLTGVEPTPPTSGQWRTFTAEQAAPLTRDAPEITMESSVSWVHPPPGQQRYYGDSNGATVTKFRIGKGEVIWWAGDSPLTNLGITKASNLELFLNSVGSQGNTRVLWDEYFHGVRLGLWHYLARSPLPWGLLQLFLLALVVIFTYARRSGAIRPIASESRLAPLEFVTTIGALYERRGAAAGALEIAFSHFRFLLTRRLGIPSAVATPDLIQTMRGRQGWMLPGFPETMERIELALKLQKVTEPHALAWIGELHDFAVRLGLEPGLAAGGSGSPPRS
jgi:hypothetical protein